MKKILFMSFLLMLTLLQQVTAQNRSISGRVTDRQTGEGIPGVTVLLKGTSNGISTNSDGTYTLNVPADGGTLSFSSIGYISIDRPIGTDNQINIGLSVDSKQLSEVVVTALGIERQRQSLGYAVTEIAPTQIVQKSEPDVLRTLQGKVPGVNIVGANGAPGSSTRITIRGNTSLLNNNQPLFVVDGIPFDNRQTNSESQLVRGSAYSNRALDIDPNNIESMSVLKGGAASALYGSRGANGVIVITTKTGSNRRNKSNVSLAYNTSYSIEKIANLPDYQNKYGSGANFTYSAANGSWGPEFGGRNAPSFVNAAGTVFPNSVRHPYDNANLGGQNLNAVFPQFRDQPYTYQAFPDNVKSFFETGSLYENSITLTGQGENTVFSGVVSRSDQQGMIPNSFFTRTNVSAGGSSQRGKLRVGANMSYVNSDQRGPQLGANNAIGNASAFGRLMFQPRNLDLAGLPNTNPANRASIYGWLTGQADNPYWSTANNGYTSRVDRVIGRINVGYDFFDWLSLSHTAGLNTYTDRRRTTVRRGATSFGGIGNIVEDNLSNTELNFTTLLTANRDINEDLNVRLIVGNDINQRRFQSASVSGDGIVQFGLDDVSNTTQQQALSPGFDEVRYVSGLADLTFGYKDWLFLNATARNDVYSTLAKKNRSFFYPSVSLSYLFTESLGLKSDVLTSGKIRGGFARTGNAPQPYLTGLNRFSLRPSFGNNAGSTGFPFNGQAGAGYEGTVSNPELTPEFTTEVEAGIELGFLSNNRIRLEATVYDKRSTNQIVVRQVATASGFFDRADNIGEISNRGIELGLDATVLQVKDFSWNTLTNFTLNRNIVEKLSPDIEQLILAANFGDIQAVHRPGQPYGSFITSSVAARDDQGNLLIDPRSGTIVRNANLPTIIGNPNPDFEVGFNNTFSYKGLTLSGQLAFRKGGDIYSTTVQSYLGRGVTKDTEDRENNIIIKGVLADPNNLLVPQRNADGGVIPNTIGITHNDYYFGAGSVGIGGASQFSVFDGTTLRLREVSLGYDLPKSLLAKTPIGSVNLSLSGRNLWWYSPYIPEHTNFDPETSTFGANNAQGFEFTNAPSARRYGINLRVTF